MISGRSPQLLSYIFDEIFKNDFVGIFALCKARSQANAKMRSNFFTQGFFSGFVLVCENLGRSDRWKLKYAKTWVFLKPRFSGFHAHTDSKVNQHLQTISR
jgi:hypothetical protein